MMKSIVDYRSRIQSDTCSEMWLFVKLCACLVIFMGVVVFLLAYGKMFFVILTLRANW